MEHDQDEQEGGPSLEELEAEAEKEGTQEYSLLQKEIQVVRDEGAEAEDEEAAPSEENSEQAVEDKDGEVEDNGDGEKEQSDGEFEADEAEDDESQAELERERSAAREIKAVLKVYKKRKKQEQEDEDEALDEARQLCDMVKKKHGVVKREPEMEDFIDDDDHIEYEDSPMKKKRRIRKIPRTEAEELRKEMEDIEQQNKRMKDDEDENDDDSISASDDQLLHMKVMGSTGKITGAPAANKAQFHQLANIAQRQVDTKAAATPSKKLFPPTAASVSAPQPSKKTSSTVARAPKSPEKKKSVARAPKSPLKQDASPPAGTPKKARKSTRNLFELGDRWEYMKKMHLVTHRGINTPMGRNKKGNIDFEAGIFDPTYYTTAEELRLDDDDERGERTGNRNLFMLNPKEIASKPVILTSKAALYNWKLFHEKDPEQQHAYAIRALECNNLDVSDDGTIQRLMLHNDVFALIRQEAYRDSDRSIVWNASSATENGKPHTTTAPKLESSFPEPTQAPRSTPPQQRPAASAATGSSSGKKKSEKEEKQIRIDKRENHDVKQMLMKQSTVKKEQVVPPPQQQAPQTAKIKPNGVNYNDDQDDDMFSEEVQPIDIFKQYQWC